MAGLDVARLRAETRGAGRVIHFNNAGAALMPDPVAEAVHAHLELEREVGGYEAEAEAAPALAAFYDEFAALLGAEPDEIAYVENATRAWDMVFYGLALAEGDRILSHGAAEYVSNWLALLHQAHRRGGVIDEVPSTPSGEVDTEALRRMIGPRTRVVALTHVPTHSGLVNPAEEVGRIARAHGLLYLLDACQSAGQIALDVRALGAHVVTGTGRKFLRGPRGTGFLYVARDALDRVEPAFVDLRAATWTGPRSYELAPGARRFETWESNVAGRIGLARAISYVRALGLPAIEARVTALAARLRAGLAALPGVTVHDRGARLCGIVTFRVAGEAPAATAARLRARGVNVSVSAASSARIDFGARGLDALVRASLHYYNTEDEIARVLDLLAGTDP